MAGVALLLGRVSSDWTTGIIHEINKLCYIGRTKINALVNNPGVELRYPLSRTGQVGHDKSDAKV